MCFAHNYICYTLGKLPLDSFYANIQKQQMVNLDTSFKHVWLSNSKRDFYLLFFPLHFLICYFRECFINAFLSENIVTCFRGRITYRFLIKEAHKGLDCSHDCTILCGSETGIFGFFKTVQPWLLSKTLSGFSCTLNTLCDLQHAGLYQSGQVQAFSASTLQNIVLQ